MPLSTAAHKHEHTRTNEHTHTHTHTHTQTRHTHTTGVASGKAEGYLVPAINTNQKPLYLIRTAVAVYQLQSPTSLFADIDWA